MFSCCLNSLGAKNSVKKKKKNAFFDASQAQNHGSCGVFLLLEAKKHGIYSVLWPEPSKNSGIYADFSMLQDVLLPPGQTHKNTVNYSVSAFETRWKLSRTTNKVKPKNCQIGGVFVFFEHSRSKKLRKNRVFWRLASPKPRYLRCFLLLEPKTTVFTVFYGQNLAKTVVFTQISACCKTYFCQAKRTKTP